MIFYSHFFPAFKAGGPVQSLINLVDVIHGDFTIDVFCGAREIGENALLKGVRPNIWCDYKPNVQVFYSSGSTISSLRKALLERRPDVLYLNGIFLPVFTWLPLYFASRYNIKAVVAPRGMLQSGALALKSLKKRTFLALFKFSRVHNEVVWHATDAQEREDILKVFRKPARIVIAPNVPKSPLSVPPSGKKAVVTLKLVYLSLITEKKNLHLVLQALTLVTRPVQFHIYGPIADKEYWSKCEVLMHDQIHEITYMGPVNPETVQQTLARYNAMILPTKGENFGHAIYEAFSVGIPVITSKFTPWGDLKKFNAGITVNSFTAKDWSCAIDSLLEMNDDEFVTLSAGAQQLAKSFFNKYNFRAMYRDLFESVALPTSQPVEQR